jgi:hypothetical protein
MRRSQGWISVVAMLCGMSGAAAATQPQEPYTPIFLMYSGEPSPERLQGLRQFLAANNTPQQVAKDAVESVIYKLKTYKAGFAYPVYFSEDSKVGNACVVADSHYTPNVSAISLVTNERIHRYVLGGHAPTMEIQSVWDSVLHHEIFHCYDLMRQSQIEIGTQIAHNGAQYFANWSETGADAFAALNHLRSGGNKALIRQIRDFRTLNLLNGDAVHYTARTLDYIVWNYDQKRLKKLNMQQLVQLAYAIREQTALTPEEYAAIEQVSGRFEVQLKSLTNDVDTAPHAQLLQTLQYNLPDPEYFTQFILQVRAALYNLGGDISTSNAYFYPIMKKYYRASFSRMEKAEVTVNGAW